MAIDVTSEREAYRRGMGKVVKYYLLALVCFVFLFLRAIGLGNDFLGCMVAAGIMYCLDRAKKWIYQASELRSQICIQQFVGRM